jgi:hypothetical protein
VRGAPDRRDDLGELGRHHLEDRGLHQEPLELFVEVADDLLGEVVVKVMVCAVQRSDEAADLRRRAIAKGGLDQLERCDPALGPDREVLQDVGIETSAVGLGE